MGWDWSLDDLAKAEELVTLISTKVNTTTSMETPAKVVTCNFLLDIDETRNILSVFTFWGLGRVITY